MSDASGRERREWIPDPRSATGDRRPALEPWKGGGLQGAPALELRPYQQAAIAAVQRLSGARKRSMLVVMATGTGKTVIFASLARRAAGRTLVLAHRDELIAQAVDKLQLVWPEARVGVVQAGHREWEPERQVVVASVQSLHARRLAELPQDFALVVTDESHHAAAATYRAIYKHLRAGSAKGPVHLGFTATPNRADRKGLGEVFGTVAFEYGLLEAIADGWLCPLEGVKVDTHVELGEVGTRGEDFVLRQLSEVCNVANRNELAVAAWKQHARGRQTVCFAVDVEHARCLAAAFVAGGVAAEWISGEMPLGQRREVLRRFHERELEVLVNCIVLSEGFDEPAISCVLLARPTRSQTMYLQAIGRGTRRYPGKKDCLVIDLADNTGRHAIVQLPDLLGRLQGRGRRAAVPEERPRPQEIGDGLAARGYGLVSTKAAFGRQGLSWSEAGRDRFELRLEDGAVLTVDGRLSGDQLGRYDVWLLLPRRSDPQRLTRRSLPLDWAMSVAEMTAKTMVERSSVLVDREAAWRKRPASEKQLHLLRQFQVFPKPGLTKGEAADLLGEIFARRSRR